MKIKKQETNEKTPRTWPSLFRSSFFARNLRKEKENHFQCQENPAIAVMPASQESFTLSILSDRLATVQVPFFSLACARAFSNTKHYLFEKPGMMIAALQAPDFGVLCFGLQNLPKNVSSVGSLGYFLPVSWKIKHLNLIGNL